MLAVIPARFASTRFPGKPLAMIQGMSMIQRTYTQAMQSARVSKVVVATDDQRIFEHVISFGGQVIMTKAEHPSGTDRCAEVAALHPDAEWVLNIQGDEPFIQPQQIDLLADTLTKNQHIGIATLAKKISDPALLQHPNTVKVVFSAALQALYFSRHAIPYLRGVESDWLAHHDYYKHIGLYGFRRDTLLALSLLHPSPLEKAESLEQLRWLENGHAIQIGLTELETIGVDAPEDLQRFT